MRNKGRKIEFCFDDEIFTTLINLNMDNKLRNAIGHASYRYDGVNQIIEYFSSGTMGKGESIKIYLMEFIQRTLSMFETILLINELVYQTKKFHLIYEGILPTYRPE